MTMDNTGMQKLERMARKISDKIQVKFSSSQFCTVAQVKKVPYKIESQN